MVYCPSPTSPLATMLEPCANLATLNPTNSILQYAGTSGLRGHEPHLCDIPQPGCVPALYPMRLRGDVGHGALYIMPLTLTAPALRTISTIWLMVVPRTMESSTSSTFFPSNTAGMAFSFLRTLISRVLRDTCTPDEDVAQRADHGHRALSSQHRLHTIPARSSTVCMALRDNAAVPSPAGCACACRRPSAPVQATLEIPEDAFCEKR